MKPLLRALALALLFSAPAAAQKPQPLLLQSPTLSKTQIAFAYGGDIWIVNREGGEARRVITGTGRASGPIFSPDGTQIAYTGNYDGNNDVYVVPAGGGDPHRLTYHPGEDDAAGWTPDGKQVLFVSAREAYADPAKLFTIPLDGVFPASLPLAEAAEASYAPDGMRLAYVPNFQWQPEWKHYRGGQTTPIWIVSLSDLSLEKISRDNSNDSHPMWVGDTIYFLSDRNGPVTLFAYDTRTKRVTQVLENHGFDFKSASAGPGGIVYEQFGSLHLYDLATRKEHAVPVSLAADMPEVRPRFEKIDPKQFLNVGISPTGARAVFEAHGEIFTVPAEKGDIRNLTRSPAVADRDPAWSPDGKSIAYFSDASGEYALYLRDQNGITPPRKIDLGNPPSFFYSPRWSPDSRKIVYSDKRLNLWVVDLDHPTPVRVDTDLFDTPLTRFDAAWSPDSRWITYTKQLPNHLHGVFVYSLEQHKSTQITDGMSDALFPKFDKNGKSLYFTASTDTGLSTGWLDMTSIGHPVTRSVYVVVLKKDLPSPLAPESDEEKGEEAKKEEGGKSPEKPTKEGEKAEGQEKAKEKKEPPKVEIDFENISQRILTMPIPPRNYNDLLAGKEGVLYLAEGPQVDTDEGPTRLTIQKFDLKTRKTDKLLDSVTDFYASENGEKMLYKQADHWFIAATEKPPEAGKGMLKLDTMEVYVDPRAEWKQMYHESWRIERDFFYDPGFHGLNLAEAEKVYAPFLDRVTSRDDLNDLFREITGNLVIGHMFVRGGTLPV